MPTNLIFSEVEWAALPERLKDPFFQNVHELNERAVAIMREQDPTNFWQLPGDLAQLDAESSNPWRWRSLKQRLYRFAISWRLTGSASSLAEALRAIDVLIQPEHWTIESRWNLKYADLRTAEFWTAAAFALEALAPRLSPHQKAELTRLLTDWALPAYLKGIEQGDWWRYAEFNWGAAVHGGAGVAALAVRDVVPELADLVLAAVRRGLQIVIDYLPAGGGWIEGLMYQTTTLTHLTEFVAALHRLDGDDLGLLSNPRLSDSLNSRQWMIGGDLRPINFSNINESTNEWRLPAAYWWASQLNRPDWAGFEDAFPRVWSETGGIAQQVETFWLRQPFQAASPWASKEGLWHGRELDWLSWKRGPTWLAFRSGFNGGNHNNLDLGQIIYGLGGQRVLGDPGYGGSATSLHSCITLKHKEQTIDATARILHAQEWNSNGQWFLHVCCDLRATYPFTLDRHHRHVIAFEDGTLFLLDELESTAKRRLGVTGRLQMNAPIEENGSGLFQMQTQSGCFYVRSHSALKFSLLDPNIHNAKTLYPLAYSLPFDDSTARMLISISPRPDCDPTAYLEPIRDYLSGHFPLIELKV